MIAETILELPRGDTASQPFRIRGTNGKDYLVKPLLNSQPRTLPNELIGSALALFVLNLPVPMFALIECGSPLITQLSIPSITSGVYFGSELLQGSFDFRISSEIASRQLERAPLSNEGDLPGVVVFDNWTLNLDRNNAGNNLLVFAQGKQAATYYMVDFGHCFTGPNWTVDSLSKDQNRLEPVPVFPFIQNRIRNSILNFDKFNKIMENIPEPIYEEITRLIPSRWPITSEEAKILKQFLNTRIPIVLKMIKDSLLS